MNEGKQPVDISLEDYGFVEELLVASAEIHIDEMGRQSAITRLLEKLLNRVIVQNTLNDRTSNDGAIDVRDGPNACLLLVREVKNNSGNGDPSAQAGYSCTRWWADPLVRIVTTVISITLTLSRGFTFAGGHAALASFSRSRVPGFACKEQSWLVTPGRCSH